MMAAAPLLPSRTNQSLYIPTISSASCLRLPLPLTQRRCRCRRVLGPLGNRRAACPQSGALRSPGSLRRMSSGQNLPRGRSKSHHQYPALLTGLNLPAVDRVDNRRIEVIANGRQFFHGAQLAVDTALVSPLSGASQPRRRGSAYAAAALHDARRAKERAYTLNSPEGGDADSSFSELKLGAASVLKPRVASACWPNPSLAHPRTPVVAFGLCTSVKGQYKERQQSLLTGPTRKRRARKKTNYRLRTNLPHCYYYSSSYYYYYYYYYNY